MLQETGLVRMLFSAQNGNRILTKPEIYLQNVSLYYPLSGIRGHEPVVGTLREIFLFQSIADAKFQIHYSLPGDFKIKDVILEVGGKNKMSKQLNYLDKNYLLVKDDIISAIPNTIPLYYFGFLY